MLAAGRQAFFSSTERSAKPLTSIIRSLKLSRRLTKTYPSRPDHANLSATAGLRQRRCENIVPKYRATGNDPGFGRFSGMLPRCDRHSGNSIFRSWRNSRNPANFGPAELVGCSWWWNNVAGLLEAESANPTQAPEDPPLEVSRSLPFEPTKAQLRTMEEIHRDLAAPRTMARLLQGTLAQEGKTFVA